MLPFYASLLAPSLVCLALALAASLSWRRQGMSLRRLLSNSPSPVPPPSSASSCPLPATVERRHHHDRRGLPDRRHELTNGTMEFGA